VIVGALRPRNGYDNWPVAALPFCAQCGNDFKVAIEIAGWPVTETCGCSTRRVPGWRFGSTRYQRDDLKHDRDHLDLEGEGVRTQLQTRKHG